MLVEEDGGPAMMMVPHYHACLMGGRGGGLSCVTRGGFDGE